jgi:transposase
MATHYGVAIVPARVRKPKDKAKAEVGVQIVERWVLASLRNHSFFSLTDLNQTIQQLLLSDVNYPVRVTTITLAGFS